MNELTAEQIRQARYESEKQAFENLGAQLRVKQLPTWSEIVGKVQG